MGTHSLPTTKIWISSLSTNFEQHLFCTEIGHFFNIPISRMFQTLVGAMQKIQDNFELRTLPIGEKCNFWSVWNFHISSVGEKIQKYRCRYVEFVVFQAKYYLFSPTIFLLHSSLTGEYSRVLHKFYTYPTPIRQNCLIGTTILDTKDPHMFELKPQIALFFGFQVSNF